MWSVKLPLENQDPFDVRPLTFGDIPSCLPIFEAAERDLRERHGLAADEASERDWLAPILTHFLTTDRSGSRIATLDGEAVAFGCSIRRDDFWFLSFLFALPRLQGRGLGRKLLTELLPGDDVALATVVESFQPVSTGLYASVGMAPRSVKYWVGDFSRPNVLPSLPNGIIRSESTERDVADIDTLDRAIVGFSRPADHVWWTDAGQRRFSFRQGDDLIAYAYVDDGFVGPVLAVDERTLSAVAGDLIRTTDDPKRMSVNVSGDSALLFRTLLEAGGRIDDRDVYRFVYCSSVGPLAASYVHHSDWLP